MPRSMTGYAQLESKQPWGVLTWELRSVNHRYLEPLFRLPDTLRALEQPLREQLRKRLQRGKLEATLHLQHSAATGAKLGINRNLTRQIAGAIDQINDLLTNAAPVSALEILRWPGVVEEQKVDVEILHSTALTLFEHTLQQLVESRTREGGKLKQFIEQRLDSIGAHVATIRRHLPSVLQAQKEKILSRLEVIKAELDNDRLEQELVYLAQKSDVDEELDRLDTHIIEVKRTLLQSNAIGRRLDFLMQELNREANTLSSKSVVSETTQVAIDIKVLIEQMREQIQNIE